MPWEVARDALDLFLAHGGRQGLIEFNGGEPLLAFDLLERSMSYAKACAEAEGVRFAVTTNGTLLTSEMMAVLAAHDVELQVSVHCGECAQKAQGTGTLTGVEENLAALRLDHPRYYRDRVQILAALAPCNIGTLGSSCRGFLARGVPLVQHYPIFGFPEPSPPEILRPLEAQMEEVVADSYEHWNRTGQIPVAFLRGMPDRLSPDAGKGACCGASATKGICVDTGGRVWTCPFFAGSLVPLAGLAREVSDATSLGSLGDEGFEARFAGLPARAARVRVLNGRDGKHSQHMRCRDCEALGGCPYCPASTAQIPDNQDPDLVPAMACAFSLASFRARRAFHFRVGGRLPRDPMERARRALQRLAEALPRPADSTAPPR
jgi:sulfatase maturation enzyme AslB (radical SAM superfamily)